MTHTGAADSCCCTLQLLHHDKLELHADCSTYATRQWWLWLNLCLSSLQKELYNKALEQASGAVRTSFSVVSPKSAVYQVGDLSCLE